MGLETGTYISDLTTTNPLSTDLRSVGDDHIRLIKTVAKNTLPNGDRAQYFKRHATKTANYVVLATDMEKSFSGDATAGSISLTLPALAAGNDGWSCEVIKSDSSANTVTVVGTINGETNIVLKVQYQAIRLLWTGSSWLALFPIVLRDGTLVLPVGTTATRPASPQKGALWYNDTTDLLEFSDATNWFSLLTTLAGAQMQYGMVLNGTIVESRAANAATFSLKTLAGTDPSATDPVIIAFRNSTIGTGNYVFRQVTAALSLVLSSGSNLGVTVNLTPFRVWLVLFDDAGTIRMGAIQNVSSGNIYPLGRIPLVSSTAEGGLGAADSAQVFYTGTAVASKPYVILGYASYQTGLASAGAWASAPTYIQLFGSGVPLPGNPIQDRFQNFSATTDLTGIGTVFTDTGLTLDLTLTDAANIVRGEAAINVTGNSPSRVGFRLLRDAVAVGVGDGSGSRSQVNASITGTGVDELHNAGFSFSDAPGDTSSHTYKVQAITSGADVRVNRTNTDTNAASWYRASSQLKLVEVQT